MAVDQRVAVDHRVFKLDFRTAKYLISQEPCSIFDHETSRLRNFIMALTCNSKIYWEITSVYKAFIPQKATYEEKLQYLDPPGECLCRTMMGKLAISKNFVTWGRLAALFLFLHKCYSEFDFKQGKTTSEYVSQLRTRDRLCYQWANEILRWDISLTLIVPQPEPSMQLHPESLIRRICDFFRNVFHSFFHNVRENSVSGTVPSAIL